MIPFAIVTPDTPLTYTPEEAAKKLGVSRKMLDGWRASGLIAPRVPDPRHPKAIRYTIFDLIRFCESLKVK